MSALSDLSRARDETGVVIDVTALGAGLVELTARLPHLASEARPGEFAQLRCGPGSVPLLRRPMSIAAVEADAVTFVFERIGEGTRLLASLRPDDPLTALGPLGNGFSVIPGADRVLCVAGGLGCAPFPLMAAASRTADTREVVILHGAATASRLYPAERFSRGDAAVRVVEVTEDGSRGHRGLVTALIPAIIAEGVDAVYACGPNTMLAAVAELLGGLSGVPAVVEVSLEAPMGCGFGTCLGCVLPVRSTTHAGPAWALCCRHGPVMPADVVDWAELATLPPANVA